jgi:hypothetical protein
VPSTATKALPTSHKRVCDAPDTLLEHNMPGNRLCAILLGVAGATLSITVALSQEQLPKHPGEPGGSATPSPVNALDLAVPLLSRDAARPSYGPAPSGETADPVAEMESMMEMDHSAHQMPASEMPGMDHGATPEDAQ